MKTREFIVWFFKERERLLKQELELKEEKLKIVEDITKIYDEMIHNNDEMIDMLKTVLDEDTSDWWKNDAS